MLTTRRGFCASALLAFGASVCPLCADELRHDPWTARELLEPALLAKLLGGPAVKPVIICVAFPVLYRQKHIANAVFAGPTSKTEGIAALKLATAPMPHDARIVLYCGCCPMAHCPNIRPAFRALKELGYTKVSVLDLPTSFRADWEDKQYPVSSR
jgi:thiosulfate/3-mercaptopyruvate sulfurtransferase